MSLIVSENDDINSKAGIVTIPIEIARGITRVSFNRLLDETEYDTWAINC